MAMAFKIIFVLGLLWALLVLVAYAIDWRSYSRLRRRFNQDFGPHIGSRFKIVSQNQETGSVLSNGLSLDDVYWERGIISYGYVLGDWIEIESYPSFRLFGKPTSPFKKVED